MSSIPKLECRSLWKIFGQASDKVCQQNHDDNAALTRAAIDHGCIIGASDVNFSVAPGELFVIMGLSGSGKSTVLRSIAQLHRPSIGQVFLDGEDLAAMSEKDLMEIRRRKMGMVFQNFGLVPHFTALENIAFPLKMRGKTPPLAAKKQKKCCNWLGLKAAVNPIPMSYQAVSSNALGSRGLWPLTLKSGCLMNRLAPLTRLFAVSYKMNCWRCNQP